ncbi:MAG: toprim domain-containing protein, partial [Alphaproteobacteria bacterium]
VVNTTNGAAVRLAEPSEMLAVAEGIETALAVQLATKIPTWATVSAHGMKTLEIPNSVKYLYIAHDHDVSGTGQRSAEALAMRIHHYGVRVWSVFPPITYLSQMATLIG